MKNLSHHFPHYITLIGILVVGFFGLVIFNFDRAFQAAIMVALASSYVVWGLVHHKIHKDLYLGVVLEYMVVAILGLIIVFSLLFRS